MSLLTPRETIYEYCIVNAKTAVQDPFAPDVSNTQLIQCLPSFVRVHSLALTRCDIACEIYDRILSTCKRHEVVLDSRPFQNFYDIHYPARIESRFTPYPGPLDCDHLTFNISVISEEESSPRRWEDLQDSNNRMNVLASQIYEIAAHFPVAKDVVIEMTVTQGPELTDVQFNKFAGHVKDIMEFYQWTPQIQRYFSLLNKGGEFWGVVGAKTEDGWIHLSAHGEHAMLPKGLCIGRL